MANLKYVLVVVAAVVVVVRPFVVVVVVVVIIYLFTYVLNYVAYRPRYFSLI